VVRFPHLTLLAAPAVLALGVLVALVVRAFGVPISSNHALLEFGMWVWFAFTLLGPMMVFWGIVGAYDYKKRVARALSRKQIASITIGVAYVAFVIWVWFFLLPMLAQKSH
jgi:hypothetical protein